MDKSEFKQKFELEKFCVFYDYWRRLCLLKLIENTCVYSRPVLRSNQCYTKMTAYTAVINHYHIHVTLVLNSSLYKLSMCACVFVLCIMYILF